MEPDACGFVISSWIFRLDYQSEWIEQILILSSPSNRKSHFPGQFYRSIHAPPMKLRAQLELAGIDGASIGWNVSENIRNEFSTSNANTEAKQAKNRRNSNGTMPSIVACRAIMHRWAVRALLFKTLSQWSSLICFHWSDKSRHLAHCRVRFLMLRRETRATNGCAQ